MWREKGLSKMFCKQHLRKAYLGYVKTGGEFLKNVLETTFEKRLILATWREEGCSKVFCKQHLRKAYLGHMKGEQFLKGIL
jgi:hypothetical protein